jgi:hypothetical protein
MSIAAIEMMPKDSLHFSTGGGWTPTSTSVIVRSSSLSAGHR